VARKQVGHSQLLAHLGLVELVYQIHFLALLFSMLGVVERLETIEVLAQVLVAMVAVVRVQP
jgi:hypothetical protein